MKKVIHKSDSRGYADHGWLKAKHSFSFANWYDPEKMNFGLMRVLNDDIIAPGTGFGTHPHDNMEIVTIPLKGAVAHKDSEGHEEVIHPDEVQVMSAGTGILHSEYNHLENEETNLFQIWIFPDRKGHLPRYDQKSFDPVERKNQIQFVVTPDKKDGNLWLNQNAYFSRTDLESGKNIIYNLHLENNGIYVMVIEGNISVTGENLKKRDAIGISESSEVEMTANEDSQLLIIEVPMN